MRSVRVILNFGDKIAAFLAQLQRNKFFVKWFQGVSAHNADEESSRSNVSAFLVNRGSEGDGA